MFESLGVACGGNEGVTGRTGAAAAVECVDGESTTGTAGVEESTAGVEEPAEDALVMVPMRHKVAGMSWELYSCSWSAVAMSASWR